MQIAWPRLRFDDDLARYLEKQPKKHLKKAIQTPTEKTDFVVKKSPWHRVRSRLFSDVDFNGELPADSFVVSSVVRTHRKGCGRDSGKRHVFVLVFDGQTGEFKWRIWPRLSPNCTETSFSGLARSQNADFMVPTAF